MTTLTQDLLASYTRAVETEALLGEMNEPERLEKAQGQVVCERRARLIDHLEKLEDKLKFVTLCSAKKLNPFEGLGSMESK